MVWIIFVLSLYGGVSVTLAVVQLVMGGFFSSSFTHFNGTLVGQELLEQCF